MSEWTTLNAAEHGSAALAPSANYLHAAAESSCPVSLRELAALLPYYPLLFARMPGPEGTTRVPHRYQLLALLSFATGRSLFVDRDGRWQAPYVPGHLRAYPFALAHSKQTPAPGTTLPEGMAVAVNSASGCLLPAATELRHRRLFTDKGHCSDYLQTVERFLADRTRDLIRTQAAVDELAGHGVIKPLPVQWSPDLASPKAREEGKLEVLQGCFAIDEKSLGDLSPAAWQSLGRSGALGLAYAQVFSLARIRDLQTRETAWQRSARPLADDELAALLGEGDETLSFNF